jgi:hypothetical protein
VVYKFLTDTGLSDEQQRALNIFFNAPSVQALDENGNPIPILDEDGNPTGEFVLVGSSNPAMFGFSGLIFNALLNSTTDPGQEALISDFFNGGASLVVQNALLNSTTDTGQETLINDFFDGGVTKVVNTALVNSTSDPTQVADINTFFNAAGNENPSQFGVSGVVYNHLLGATEAGTAQRDLVDQFFTNGISGVVNYILTGATIPAADPPPPPVQNTLRVSTFSAAAPADDPVDTTPVKTDPVGTTPIVKKAAPVLAAATISKPAAPVAPVSAPEPVKADPTPAVVKTDKTDKKDDANEIMKNGGDFTKNDDDPIILPGEGKGPKDGEGSWGIFGAVAGAVGNFITGGGGTPAPATTPSTEGAAG